MISFLPQQLVKLRITHVHILPTCSCPSVHILPTCSCPSVESDSIIRINIMSTVKLILVCGILPCGLVAANRRFRLIYSDNKGRKFVNNIDTRRQHHTASRSAQSTMRSLKKLRHMFILFCLWFTPTTSDCVRTNYRAIYKQRTERGNGQSQTNVRC